MLVEAPGSCERQSSLPALSATDEGATQNDAGHAGNKEGEQPKR